MRISDWIQTCALPIVEFFLFKSPTEPVPLDQGSYFDLTPLDSAQDFRRKAIQTLEAMGISVEYSHNAVAPSRSAERRVGKECVRTCSSRWWPVHSKTKHKQIESVHHIVIKIIQ